MIELLRYSINTYLAVSHAWKHLLETESYNQPRVLISADHDAKSMFPLPSSPDVAAFIGFAVQAKLRWFESTGASAFHTLFFNFNPCDKRDRSLLGRGVLTTPPFTD